MEFLLFCVPGVGGIVLKVEKGLRFAFILAILTTFRPSNLCMVPGTCRKKFCSVCSVSLLPENPYFSSAGGAIRGANGRLHQFLCSFPGKFLIFL
jgi:hypothetical protein